MIEVNVRCCHFLQPNIFQIPFSTRLFIFSLFRFMGFFTVLINWCGLWSYQFLFQNPRKIPVSWAKATFFANFLMYFVPIVTPDFMANQKACAAEGSMAKIFSTFFQYLQGVSPLIDAHAYMSSVFPINWMLSGHLRGSTIPLFFTGQSSGWCIVVII